MDKIKNFFVRKKAALAAFMGVMMAEVTVALPVYAADPIVHATTKLRASLWPLAALIVGIIALMRFIKGQVAQAVIIGIIGFFFVWLIKNDTLVNKFQSYFTNLFG